MFCPQCGQQQHADAVRFCKRCGFALDAVAELVTGGGQPACPRSDGGRDLTPRQRGMRLGALIMAGGLMFGGVAALLSAMKEDLFVFLPLAAFVFTVGLMRLLYGLLLEADAPTAGGEEDATAMPRRMEGARGSELPPARGTPVTSFNQSSADTKEMAGPPSVTESTTKLLEEEREAR